MTNRNEPLKILDEIESDGDHLAGCVVWDFKLIGRLRLALEAQRDELALVKWHNERLDEESLEQARELAQKDARIARLESALSDLLDDENGPVWGVAVRQGKAALNEHPRQSAAALTRDSAERSEAALKAEALLEAASAATEEMQHVGFGYAGTSHWLIERAKRIKRDAEEQGDEK